MKQHITIKQYRELKGEGVEKWVEWCLEKKYDFSQFPDIGQMIEFLDENDRLNFSVSMTGPEKEYIHNISFVSSLVNPKYKDPCDALWEAVKEVLEQ